VLFIITVKCKYVVTAAKPRAKIIFGEKLCSERLTRKTPATNVFVALKILRSLAADFAD
jgi:hypothetical protein